MVATTTSSHATDRGRSLAALASEAALARAAVGLGTAVFVWYWVRVALERWRDFQTHAFDLGFFDQVVWNTAQGRVFETTFVPYNFGGQHLEPVLLVFAAAYRLGAGPLSLVVTQAVVAGLATLLLFEAVRRLGLGPLLSLTVAFAYLFNAYLHRALLFDFHPEVMVAAPAFGALWAIAAGRPRIAMLCALSALLFKEDAVFVTLSLAAVFAWRGYRGTAAATTAIAIAWTLVALGVVMPLLRDGQSSDLNARYASLTGGEAGLGAVTWFATHPLEVLRAMGSGANLGTAARFLAASGPVLLAAPWTVVMLAPGLLLALMSSHPAQSGLELHYAAELVPVATLATVVGLVRLTKSPRLGAPRWQRTLAALVVAPALVGFVFLSPASPSAPGIGAPPTAAHRAAIEAAVALVPPGASVSAQSGVLPRLSHREVIFEFPGGWDDAEWVLIDEHGYRTSQTIEAGYDAAVAQLRANQRPVFERDGVLLFEVGRP